MIRKPGLYLITNTVNGHYYGGSSFNMAHRWCMHKKNAKEGSNKCRRLYDAIRKYGIKNFTIKPLLICETQHLKLYEQKWLDRHHGKKECYNLSPSANSNRGVKFSEITKKKLSCIARKNRNMKLLYSLISKEKKKNLRKSIYRNHCRGSMHHMAKLTMSMATKIRQLHNSEKYSYSQLANKYGCSKKTIVNVVHFRIWKQ